MFPDYAGNVNLILQNFPMENEGEACQNKATISVDYMGEKKCSKIAEASPELTT